MSKNWLVLILLIPVGIAVIGAKQGADPDDPCTITITKSDPWIRFIRNTVGPAELGIKPRPRATITLSFEVLGDSVWKPNAWNFGAFSKDTLAPLDTTSGRWSREDVGVTIENCFLYYESR